MAPHSVFSGNVCRGRFHASGASGDLRRLHSGPISIAAPSNSCITASARNYTVRTMKLFERVSSDVRTILDRALEDHEISWQEGLRLCQTEGIDFQALIVAADELRRRQVGDVVTYVIN